MVNVDTVYQTVLAIANKEQRGYITPQEFNLFANHAQMEIFEQYFYDKNQFSRIPGNSTEHSDMLDLLKEKISIFKKNQIIPILSDNEGNFPIGMYRLGNLYDYTNNYKIEEVDHNELSNLENSIVKPKKTSGYVFTSNSETFSIYPKSNSLGAVGITYVSFPLTVNWGYNVVDEHALHDPGTSVNFELHRSEVSSLVMKILSLAGISLKETALYQTAEASEVKKTQQEKQ